MSELNFKENRRDITLKEYFKTFNIILIKIFKVKI